MRQKIYKHSFNHIKDHAGLRKTHKQAGAELGQAQLPIGIWLYWDFLPFLPYID